MKYFVLLIAFCVSQTFLAAQKFDYIWIMGDDNQTFDTTHGGSLLDFNFSPPKTSYHYREYDMNTTNSSICDTVGNLLFYTNGCVIAGEDDQILENGDNINPGTSHTLWCTTYDDGYAGGPGNSLILAVPDSANLFYLFHKRFVLYNNPSDAVFDKLYFTIVNGGEKHTFEQSKVIQKNIELISDTLARGEIAAVKHANGKDWWLVTPRRNSNQFYIFKFTNQGIIDTFKQTIGILPDPQGEGLGQMVFSSDGSKLYRTCRYKPVMVYSFDREMGVFTQFDTIPFEYGNQLVGEIGCAISPSNQYLYLSCRKSLYQLDLFASNISATQIKVAEWDGNADPFPTMFWQCQLGPDCKIYIVAGGDTRYYHVIHNPDEPGLACNVEQRGVKFQTPTGASMPFFPNYRLGPLNNPGSPCTATVAVNQPLFPIQNKPIWVYPNPANNSITVEYPSITGSDSHFLLFNTLGQMVKDAVLPQGQNSIQLSLNELSGGVYWYAISGAKNNFGKLVINQ